MKFRAFFNLIDFFLLLNLVECTTKTVNLQNEKQGQLKTTHSLELIATKKFALDSITAPQQKFAQLYSDSIGDPYFTFLNTYDNSIYFYNYNNLSLTQKIIFESTGPNGVKSIKGYYIKNMDSIYLYNKPLIQVVLANNKGKILNKYSLRGEIMNKVWPLYYPQYYPLTVNPFIETNKKLLLTGQYFFSIPMKLISKFKFMARIDIKSAKVNFEHTYPQKLYGSGYNWEGGFLTTPFPELHPDGNTIIYSFPVSHDLYFAKLGSEDYKKVFAGSNLAGTINSIARNPKKTSNELIILHYLKQDLYAAIRYDKYRNIYYRFLLNGIPNATLQTRKQEKPITVIIMNEDFNYLGETVIGTCENWNWQNSFVTEEGLNIEYIGNENEDYLILKIFTLKKK